MTDLQSLSNAHQWNEDLFNKYSEYKSKDSSGTDTSKLTPDQLELVEKALNTSFLNPKFKMKHFVTSGQTTPYSTVRQWLIELKTIEENCETFEHMLKKFELEKKICEIKISRESDELQLAVYQLELNKINHDFTQSRRRLSQHYIEREQYIQLINEYLEGPNGKTPDGKSWLDVFGNMEEENYWEAHYWTVRLAKQAAMDIVAYGRIGAGNMDAITQLAKKQQEETIALTHEVSLRLESISNGMRMEVHNNLLKTDSEYAALMTGKHPNDLNSIEFNVNDLVPKHEQIINTDEQPTSDEDLINVYHNRNS